MAKPPCLILAPSNLGLRPNGDGSEPGTWRAPQALLGAGLAVALETDDIVLLPRPGYKAEAQAGTRIRNGQTIRSFSLLLSDAVRGAFARDRFPLVIGGDCSVLLGCLHGLRRAGGRGLVHVDGHSDFSHPGTYDTAHVLGAVAGMDLALASGRGEPLLTQWDGVDGPLAADADIVQIGERDAKAPDFDKFYAGLAQSAITRITIQQVEREGIGKVATRIVEMLERRGLERIWLHVDLDVLDERVMPAVDSPGQPGLTFAQLSELCRTLRRSGRVAGADFAIYDPARDPRRKYAGPIVQAIAAAFTPGRTP